jgi:hypothetical protein
MNWIPVILGILVVTYLLWWVWQGLNNLGA